MSRGKCPVQYDHIEPLAFGGTLPKRADLRTREGRHPAGSARKHDVLRARHAQWSARDSRRLVASGVVGRGNEHRHPSHRHLHAARDGAAVRRHGGHHGGDRPCNGGDPRARQVSHRARRRALDYVAGRRRRWRRSIRACRCLQIDAHADLRDTYMGTRFNHACAMRRVLEHARCTQVGIRSMSTEEAKAAPTLPTTIFYDVNMRRDTNWIDEGRGVAWRDRLHDDRRATAWTRPSCRRRARPSRAG